MAQPQPTFQANAPWQGVAIDRELAADGGFWCRGHRYKMRFGADGAGYMPLFGAHVHQNPLLTFALADSPVTAVQLRDDGCDLERGAILERWNLASEHAEQTFRLVAPPATGALRIQVTSSLPEFAFRKADAAGLHFAADGLGEVVYSPAFVVADDGARTPLATTWQDGAIEISLPENATYPLTIDPVVSTLPIAVGEPGDDLDPEVSYDASSAKWIVVWQQRLSALDSDILFRRYTPAGLLVGTGSAETSGAVAEDPSVGNCASTNNFFVAWREGTGSIMGRRITANTGGVGVIETVINTIGMSISLPTVGGSSAAGFLVTYTLDNLVTSPIVQAAHVPATSGTINRTDVYTGSFCTAAHVGTATGNPEHWVVVGQSTLLNCISGTAHYAILDANLNLVVGPTSVPKPAFTGDFLPRVASDGVNVAMVWTRSPALGLNRLFAQTLRRVSGAYIVTNAPFEISAIEPGTSASESYSKCDIACDGARFCYAYRESGANAPRFATFGIVNDALVFYEGHTGVGGSSLLKSVSGLASQGESGGPAARFLLVSEMTVSSSQRDLEGTFLDAFQSGSQVTIAQTGCHALGSLEPVVTTTGSSLLGSTLTVSVAGTVGVPFMLAGLPIAAPLTLCGGSHIGTCRLGVQLPVILTVPGSQMSVAIPLSASYVGVGLSIQGLDAFANACPSSLFGLEFAVTDTVNFTIR